MPIFPLRFSYAADTASDAFVYKGQRYDEYGDRGHRSEIEAVHHFSPTEQTRVAWGASWRQDTLHAKYRLGPDKVVRDVGRVFANAEWKPLAWLTANLGASSEYDTLAGNNVSPRGSLNFHLTPDNTIRLGYANAWRTGGILDYRANPLTGWAGNRDLPSERLDSWEIGYLGDWKSWRMSLDVRRYQEKIGNRSFKIKPINTYDSIEPIQDIRIDGIEYQWKWQPLDNTRLVVAQTFTSIGSDYTPEALADPRTNILVAPGRKVLIEELAQESAPRRMSSLLWIQKLPAGFEASLARYWVDPMKWTRSTFVKTYVRTDARLAYGFRLGGQRGEIAYTVQSLDGAHGEFKYEGDQPADRVVDRRHWVSLRLDF